MTNRVLSILFSAPFAAITLSASTTTIVSSAALAQARPHVGVLVGVNSATIANIDKNVDGFLGGNVDKQRRTGLNAGVFVTIPLPGMFSLQPEVHYTQTGLAYAAATEELGKLAANIDYVEVPVLLRFDAGSEASSIRPMLLLGASGAFRVKCNTQLTDGGGTQTQKCMDRDGVIVTDLKSGEEAPARKDFFKKSDFGLVGGAGVSVKAGGRTLSLQGRYTHGLSNIATDHSDPDVAPKNRVFALLLGISF